MGGRHGPLESTNRMIKPVINNRDNRYVPPEGLRTLTVGLEAIADDLKGFVNLSGQIQCIDINLGFCRTAV